MLPMSEVSLARVSAVARACGPLSVLVNSAPLEIFRNRSTNGLGFRRPVPSLQRLEAVE